MMKRWILIESSQNILTNKEMYDIFLLFQSFDDIKRSILMVLMHIYPKEASARQIAELSGYSTKSKYIFKSCALEMMEKEKIISIFKPGKHLMQIKLNPDNDLLVKFSQLCQIEGKNLQELFLGKILDYE